MSKKSKDITGCRYGKWIVLSRCKERDVKGSQFWVCKCDCGNIKPINKYQLTGGKCSGCIKCSNPHAELTGREFGKLKVLGTVKVFRKKRTPEINWECQCECGKKLVINTTSLTSGRRTRCRKCTFEDLTGQRFGNQTVIKRDVLTRKWLIKCDCGFEKWKKACTIKQTKTCGRCETARYIGKKYNKLTILEITGSNEKGNSIVKCQCDCGSIIFRTATNIVNGRQRSCGCYRNEINRKKAEKLIGIKIGNIKIKKIIGFEPNTSRIVFLGKCSCGKELIIPRKRLGSARSCGCLIGKSMRGENHHQAKLTNEDVKSIKLLLDSKLYKLIEIAKMFYVSLSIISKIKNRKTYFDIKIQ